MNTVPGLPGPGDRVTCGTSPTRRTAEAALAAVKCTTFGTATPVAEEPGPRSADVVVWPVGGPGGAGFVAVFAGAVGLGVVPRVVVFARVDVLGLLAVLVVVGADVIAPVDAVGDGA